MVSRVYPHPGNQISHPTSSVPFFWSESNPNKHLALQRFVKVRINEIHQSDGVGLVWKRVLMELEERADSAVAGLFVYLATTVNFQMIALLFRSLVTNHLVTSPCFDSTPSGEVVVGRLAAGGLRLF